MGQVISFLLENYGALGIMFIVIGALGWFVIKELRNSNKALIDKQSEMNKDMTTTIAKSMQELSLSLTNDLRDQNKQFINHLLNNENNKEIEHQENLINRRKVTKEINNILSNIKNSLEADRVAVFEFHNSYANQTGFPFLKYTMTYEKIAKGCMPIQQQYQASPFSSISEISEVILEKPNHIYLIHSKDEMEEICPIMLTDNRIIVGSMWKGIFDSTNNLLIGLLYIEYKNKIYEGFDKVEIISAARNIGELITLSKSEN